MFFFENQEAVSLSQAAEAVRFITSLINNQLNLGNNLSGEFTVTSRQGDRKLPITVTTGSTMFTATVTELDGMFGDYRVTITLKEPFVGTKLCTVIQSVTEDTIRVTINRLEL